MLMLAIVAAMLLAAGWKSLRAKTSPPDKKEMARHRLTSEQKCRDWTYPFE
jgi:hypothetical protein